MRTFIGRIYFACPSCPILVSIHRTDDETKEKSEQDWSETFPSAIKIKWLTFPFSRFIFVKNKNKRFPGLSLRIPRNLPDSSLTRSKSVQLGSFQLISNHGHHLLGHAPHFTSIFVTRSRIKCLISHYSPIFVSLSLSFCLLWFYFLWTAYRTVICSSFVISSRS